MTPQLAAVAFHGDTLFAADKGDGVMVALRPICEALGLDWKTQYRKVKADPLLSKGVGTMPIPSPGGMQDTVVLPLRRLPAFLVGIDARRVKPEARDRVLLYQEECHEALARYFYGRQQAEMPQPAEAMAPLIRAVAECRHVFGCQAAAQLWFRLSLPVVPAMQRAAAQFTLPWGSDAPGGAP